MHYLYGNSNRCQACIRCIEGVCISEGPLWEVPLLVPCRTSCEASLSSPLCSSNCRCVGTAYTGCED